MPRLHIPRLYAILDPEQIAGKDCPKALHELLEGGAKFLQLRVKSLSARDFFELARRARTESLSYRCKLIVNDRVDIALACDADGVHLGQEDLPLTAARKLVGNKIIGVSTHDLDQARQAEKNGADYIGFGPMFGTATKDTGYAARGLEGLRQIRGAVMLPIVAIGGITENNVQQVWQAGADSAAIISDILRAADIADKVARLLRRQETRDHQTLSGGKR